MSVINTVGPSMARGVSPLNTVELANSATCGDRVDVELDHGAVGEQLSQGVAGVLVGLAVTELRHDHATVTDVEVDVAGREVVAFVARADPVRGG